VESIQESGVWCTGKLPVEQDEVRFKCMCLVNKRVYVWTFTCHCQTRVALEEQMERSTYSPVIVRE